jgi:ubiquinone/menaquinone biosynthesis C-methylase UbiE
MGRLIQEMMSFLFFHLYHSFAWAYDIVAKIVSNGKWFDWGKSLSDFISKEQTILELGFGTGHFQEHLLKNDFNVIGIDESSSMAKISNRRLKPFSSAKLIRANALNLPFFSNQFDRIIAIFPSGYIFQTVYQEEVRKLLKPGGYFIILLGVQFTGSSIRDAIYRMIYSITGQQINTRIVHEILDQNQFSNFKNVNFIEKKLNTHKLIILIAEK